METTPNKRQNKPPTQRSARAKVMDLLAKRDHSELELRKKLADTYSSEEIEDAIDLARESRWLAPPDEIAARAARALGRKRKSHRYISQFLAARGLPQVNRDLEGEIEKGLALVRSRLRSFDLKERESRTNALLKARRLLTNRGFDGETIRRVLDRLTSAD